MTCIRIPGGGVVCFRGRKVFACAFCGFQGTHQCDWKLHGPKKGKTCDVWMCEACAYNVAENKDLCPPHRRLWDKHPKNPSRKVDPAP